MNQEPESSSEFRFPRPEIGGWEFDSNIGNHELSAEELVAIGDWLVSHPEEAKQLPDLQDLVQLCRLTLPPEPSEKAWGDLLSGTIAQMSTSVQGTNLSETHARKKKSEFGHRWLRTGLMGAAAAAAILLAVFLANTKRDSIPPDFARQGPESLPFDGELPILGADDVDLVSVPGNGSNLLVVGNPPMSGPLVLVATGDVTLESVEPDVDGMVPKVQMNSVANSPIIVAPIREKDTKEPAAQ